MPEATYYPTDPKSNDAQMLEQAYADEHNARIQGIDRAWRYYYGDHDKPLKVQGDGYDDNVAINHVGALADRITAFMIGDGLDFDAGGDDQESELDEAIEELWRANRGDILKESLVLSGAVEGHLAVRITPSDGDYPKLTRLRQSHFSAFWNPFDTSDVLWYRLEHIAGSLGKRIDYVRGRLREGKMEHDADGWTEIVYEARDVQQIVGQRARWVLKASQPWPYEWAPIVDWQNLPENNGYYGRSDLTGAIALNDALNFILSNAQRIVKHHADPKTIGTGFTAQELVKTAVGGFFTVANENARIYNLEMQSDGALVRWLTESILGGLWQSGGMVDSSTVKDMVGQLTNFGLKVLFANAIQQTEKKRLLYAEALEAICQRALELAGRQVPDSVACVWGEVLPGDDESLADVLMRELEMGIISKRTYRMLRGYDDEQEAERLAEESAVTGDVGTNILNLLATNRPFNRGV